jgi:hypothetical protein
MSTAASSPRSESIMAGSGSSAPNTLQPRKSISRSTMRFGSSMPSPWKIPTMAMRPPPDTERNSTRSTSKEPVASRQKRGPMPPQRAPITTGSSAIGSAPATSSSSAERRAFRSASSTGPKPKLLSSSAARPPIGPPPATSTGSPGIGSTRSRALCRTPRAADPAPATTPLRRSPRRTPRRRSQARCKDWHAQRDNADTARKAHENQRQRDRPR